MSNAHSADQIEAASKVLTVLLGKHLPHRNKEYQVNCELCIYIAEAIRQEGVPGHAIDESIAFLDRLTIQERAYTVNLINAMFYARPPIVRPLDETEKS